MANNLTDVFETIIVPAAISAAATPQYTNPLLDRVWTDFRQLNGRLGETMKIPIPVPNENDVVDIGSGDLQPTDGDQDMATITININDSDSKVIRTFDQVRTSLDFEQMYMAAMIESIRRKVNRRLAVAMAAGFTTNTAVSGTGSKITRANLGAAWAALMSQGAPMNPQDLTAVLHPDVYGGTMGDQNFNYAYIVGEQAAKNAQQKGMLAPALQAEIFPDQTLSSVSGTYGGMYFHRYSTALCPVKPPKTPDFYGRETVIDLAMNGGNVPLHLQWFYDGIKQGHVLHAHLIYGLSVIRPEWGVNINVAA